ncbi:MAG: pilus assembly protein [Stenotrophomonas maltophilia]
MNRLTCFRAAALVVLWLAATPAALANLTVHPMRLAVEGTHGTQIRVYSQSPQTQYVQATVKRIIDPATAQEREVEVAPGELDAIAITPGKFALAGGGNRLVRVIPLTPVAQETAYRVYFEGVRPEEESTELPVIGGEANARVGVSLVWGALVNVVPREPFADMRLQGEQLHNIGNVRLGVTRVEHCDGQGRCQTHAVDHSVYPGQPHALPFVPQAGHSVRVHYRLSHAGYRSHERVLSP